MKLKKKRKGFGLLEVLVSLAIISIGGLGYVRSQISSLKSISDTVTRTLATILVQDMASRMQANTAEVWQGVSSGYLSASPVSNNNCYASASLCTSNQMALNDLQEWNTMISNSFPSGISARGLVCLDSPAGTATVPVSSTPVCGTAVAGTPPTFTIKLYWKGSNSTTYNQVQSTTVQAPLANAAIYPLPET